MNRRQDPLWPMLLGLFALLGGALSLEHFARRREAQGTLVRIEGSAAVTVDGAAEDDGDDDEPEFDLAPPVGEDHARARLACRRGQWSDCLEAFAELSGQEGAPALLHAEHGYWLLRARHVQAAVTELERAQLLEPGSALIALNLGAARRRSGDLAGAEREFRRAMELRTNWSSAKLALGQVLGARGALEEAVAVLGNAASSGGNELRARALSMLGRIHLKRGQREEAERAFKGAIERAPASVDLRLRIARLYLGAGRGSERDKALELARQASVLAPDDAEVQVAVARIRERAASDGSAIEAYRRAVQLDPKHRYATRRLLRLSLEREDFDEAERCSARLLSADAEDPEHHFLAGLVAAREGRDASARDRYREAIRRSELGYPEASFNLGILEKRSGNLEASIAAYQEAVRARPEYVAAWNNLGVALAAAGQTSDAEAAYQRAIAADVSYAPAWVNLAELYGRNDRRGEAQLALERAARLRPDVATRLALAKAREAAGNADAALADYRAIVREHPRHAAAWSDLAGALLAKHDLDAADAAVRKALELAPDEPAFLGLRGRIELARGRWEDAKRTYEDVLDHVPSDAVARLALAEALRRLGDVSGCEREATRVATADPNNRAVSRLLDGCRVATAQR